MEFKIADGTFVYVLNARGSNLFSFGVQPGFNDDGKRVSHDDLEQITSEIVQAVNSHEALVEACKGIIDVIDKIKPLPTGGIPLKKAYDALDAALKLAGVKL